MCTVKYGDQSHTALEPSLLHPTRSRQSSHQGTDTVGSPVMVHPFYVNIYTQNTLDQRVLEGIQGNTNLKLIFETWGFLTLFFFCYLHEWALQDPKWNPSLTFLHLLDTVSCEIVILCNPSSGVICSLQWIMGRTGSVECQAWAVSTNNLITTCCITLEN